MRDWQPWSFSQQLEQGLRDTFDDLCTGCGYCLPCPQELPIPQLMDAYNQQMLAGGNTQAAINRMKWHWQIREDLTLQCTECGRCEEACTQHLPIRQRLRELPSPT